MAVTAARADDIADVKARAKAEAQRVEKEFTDSRAEAYRLVRRDDPKLLESTEKLINLLEMVKSDTSLPPGMAKTPAEIVAPSGANLTP